MDRPINNQERVWVRIALEQENEKTELNVAEYLPQIESLRVIEECDCGDDDCFSVRFGGYKRGTSRGLADGTVDHPTKGDDMHVTVFVNMATGQISELETTY